jgi:hypothetical protein
MPRGGNVSALTTQTLNRGGDGGIALQDSMPKINTRKKPDLSWDEGEIGESEAEYRLKAAKEDESYSDYRGKDLEWALEKVMEDTDLFELAWETLCEDLTERMKQMQREIETELIRTFHQQNVDYLWTACVSGFGWRSLSGHTFIKAKTGKELLQRLLPRNTPCTFRIWIDVRKKIMWIQNFHHDAPTGNEWYSVRPANVKEVEKLGTGGFVQ